MCALRRLREPDTITLSNYPHLEVTRTEVQVRERISLYDLEGDALGALETLTKRLEGLRRGEFQIAYSYDDHSPYELDLTGWRDPTPDEKECIDRLWVKEDAKRAKKKEADKKTAAKAKEKRLEQERKEFERLSKKFANG